MATNYLYLNGIAHWAKVYPENVDEYKGVQQATVDLELPMEQVKALKAAGSALKPRITDDGKMVVKVRRKIEHRIPELGGFPIVLDAEGAPTNKLIGNGSKVTVKVSVYDAGDAKGTKLESIRVDELVEYEAKPKDITTEADTKFLTGLPF